jgi:hypothetical protein
MPRARPAPLPARRGRPRLAIANRPTRCPLGHEGDIVLYGRRQWAKLPFARQRFQCRPVGDKPHTFSLGRRPATHDHPSGLDCPTCDITPGVAQEPLSPVAHLHSAVEIAHLLRLVAQGVSLRKASETVRIEAQRFETDRFRPPQASRQHILAARYLDLFGSAIDDELAPTECPPILILDSVPLNLRAYGAERFWPGWNREERGGAILIAMGASGPDRRPLPWRIAVTPDETGNSWREFLDVSAFK